MARVDFPGQHFNEAVGVLALPSCEAMQRWPSHRTKLYGGGGELGGARENSEINSARRYRVRRNQGDGLRNETSDSKNKNCNSVSTSVYKSYRSADKSLVRPGRKEAWKHVREARDFNNIETRAVIKFFFPARQGAEGNSRHSDRNIILFPSWSG